MESFNEVSLNKEISLITPTMTEHMLHSGTADEPRDLTGFNPFDSYTIGKASEDISTPTEESADNTEENTNNILERTITAGMTTAKGFIQQMSQLLGSPSASVSENIAAENIDHTDDADSASETEGAEEYESDGYESDEFSN